MASRRCLVQPRSPHDIPTRFAAPPPAQRSGPSEAGPAREELHVPATPRRFRSPLLPAMAALASWLAAGPALAASAPKPVARPAVVTDASAVYSVPAEQRPLYLTPWTDPTFSTTLTRITPDPGASTSPVSGSWGSDTRHVYSKQQPWSSDASLYIL